jgi:hypothetical protein
MAVTRQFAANKAKQIRRDNNGADPQGCGDDRHMLVGPTGAGADERHYRSLLQVAWNWTGVARLIKAELAMKVEDDSTHFSMGSKAKIRVERATEGWSDGTNGENVWTAGDYEAVSATGGVEKSLAINPSTGMPQDEAWLFVDITNLIKPVVPKSVKYVDNTVGGGGTNYGFYVKSPGDQTVNSYRAIFRSFHDGTAGNRPYVLITYDPVNRAPTAPTLLNPGTTNVSFGDVFEGQHADPDLDPMAARLIEVWLKDQTDDVGKVATWTLPASLQSAGSDETQTGRFSVPLSLAAAALKLQTDYEWRAKTKDPAGLWGPFSAVRALRITSSAPTVLATALAPVAAMSEAHFGGTYSDPEGNPLAQFELQMQPVSAHTDAAFADSSTRVWDTGVVLPSADEITSGVIARPYGGRPLTAGTYTYRIRAQDSRGSWSPWSYIEFTLTADFNPDLGDVELTTQIARNAPVRVALYKMGTLRGRGALIGYVDDPMDLGASAYLNGGGEVYFSLPALHPYCPYIEAHQTHFAVEQFYGDRYATKFAGIITDFDADTDSVVFYGTDYLGLLQTAVDERYDPANAEKAATGTGGGGSKYIDKTLDWIIKDQIDYHKNLPDSPVGFITRGPITALAERATIYSTYAECLPFITGLIDSHKQGTGREARFYAKPTNADFSAWQWTLVDNWGRDRPNIELEYGGLLNDFRVVALGDFATRVLSVGQKRGEVKVYRAVGKGGLVESQWGRRAKTAFFPDIIDQNDLQRRANENANVLSKIGKRMALAIRADMLTPFDGWDLGDNILIRIERGVVDTLQYGSSGYWTIYGVEWRYYPDGHTDMTLTVMPKKTSTPPDPDLIPSINPGLPKEWQVGYGVPVTFGEPPINTPEAFGVGGVSFVDGSVVITPLTLPLSTDPITSQFYEDLNTGCVYEVDEDTGLYAEVYCPPIDGGPPPGSDTTPPAVPTLVSLTSALVEDATGASLIELRATITHPADADLFSTSVQFTYETPEPPNPDPALETPIWLNASVVSIGPETTVAVLRGVAGNKRYWARANSRDISGNTSGYTATVTAVTIKDATAPTVPSGLTAVAGFKAVGLNWDPSTAADLMFNEIRYAPDNGAGAPDTTASTWTPPAIRARVNTVVITDLPVADPPTAYWFQVRAVDYSGNVATSDAVATPVDYLANPEAGWSAQVSAIPTLVGAEDMAFDEVVTNFLTTGEIDAGMITAGTIKVNSIGDGADGIEVWQGTKRVGYWNDTGLYVGKTADGLPDDLSSSDYVRITDAGITVYLDGVAQTAITPDGINATAINFGRLPGGMNLVKNSSFELAAFSANVPTAKTWTATADWTGTQQTNTNGTNGATAVTVTASTY